MEFNQAELEALVKALETKYDSISESIKTLYDEQDEVSDKLEDVKEQLNDLLYSNFEVVDSSWFRLEKEATFYHDELLSIIKVLNTDDVYINYMEYTKRIDDGSISFRAEQLREYKPRFARMLKDCNYVRIDEEAAKEELLELLKL